MFTLWFIGLNCQNEEMVVKEEMIIKKVKKFLEAKGLAVIYLNGSNCEDVKWAVYVAELLNKQGVTVIASFISFFKLRTFAKNTITKYIEVWVKGVDKTHVFAQESCDILVDLNLNSVKSCARLVESYLYLHKVLFISKGAKEL